jgi:hypothetical protein
MAPRTGTRKALRRSPLSFNYGTTADDRNATCPHCDAIFPEFAIRNHLLRAHPDIAKPDSDERTKGIKTACLLCNKVYTKIGIRKHISNGHTEVWKPWLSVGEMCRNAKVSTRPTNSTEPTNSAESTKSAQSTTGRKRKRPGPKCKTCGTSCLSKAGVAYHMKYFCRGKRSG